jgi:geranylgeranyl diphosphate synthase type II
LDGALHRLNDLVRGAIDAMPPCPNGAELRALMLSEAKRLVPARLAQFAA